MTFQSGLFLLIFLPAVLGLHLVLPRRASWQNGLLLAASWLFYFTWAPRYVPLLLVVTALHYAAGRGLGALRPTSGEAEAPGTRRGATLLLALVVAADVGLLLAFKYLGFLAHVASGLGTVLGLNVAIAAPSWVVPLGISFWTLQQIGYLADVYMGRIEPCRSALTFATFSAFFPQIQAGPIPRSDQLDQLSRPRLLTLENLRTGSFRFFRGFVSRFLIAATLGNLLVDPVFSQAGQVSALRHWAALLGYAGQAFCDFAGYTDMAIGIAIVLGVRLPENFNAPFLAQSLLEVWRRWNMSFNNWLFEYIYSPLVTGSGWLRGRLDLGFLIVFLVSGLWHGAAWTFVLWGALQGVGLVVHRRYDEFYRGLCRQDRKWVARRKSRGYRWMAWGLTQAFFVLTLIPFRASSLGDARAFASGLLQTGVNAGAGLPLRDAVNLSVCVALLLGYHALRGRSFAFPAVARGVVYGLLIVYLAIFMPIASGTFIYAQF